MKKLIELLNQSNANVVIIAEDGTILTKENTTQGLLEQMIIYRELDEQEGWQEDIYALSVRIDDEECYRYCDTSEAIVEELKMK